MLAGTKGPYTLVIQPDNDPISPRRDGDNFGTMVCFNRHYNLGDVHHYGDKDDFLRAMYLKTVGDDEQGARRYERSLDLMNSRIKEPFDSPAYERAVDERLLRVISEKYIVLPLYFYDHTIQSISTERFAGRALHGEWDSGQVGWIYASKADALKEYGGTKLTAQKQSQAEKLLRSEVEAYDFYLRGECYGYELYKNGEQEDSCWGFLGDLEQVRQSMEEYLPEACKGITEDLVRHNSPQSMIKLLLRQARQQIDQELRSFERSRRQKAIAGDAR